MTVTVEGIVAACVGLLAVFAVVGVVIRVALVPYLRTHLVEPVADVRENISNSNSNPNSHPTSIRDDLDVIRDEVKGTRRDLTDVLVWKREDHRRIWHAIEEVRRLLHERLEEPK